MMKEDNQIGGSYNNRILIPRESKYTVSEPDSNLKIESFSHSGKHDLPIVSTDERIQIECRDEHDWNEYSPTIQTLVAGSNINSEGFEQVAQQHLEIVAIDEGTQSALRTSIEVTNAGLTSHRQITIGGTETSR
jgi:hypothetical protein